MSAEAVQRGRLIAVEGTRGRDVAQGARRVWDALRAAGVQGGISWWDASGTFFEARQVKRKEFVPSPRTLVLFYVVDLKFRLKWEIEPLLAEGRTVIAAGYTSSIRAFARAAGIPKAWVDTVFETIPAPDVTLRAKERKQTSAWKGDPEEGFCETCVVAMVNDRQRFDAVRLRRDAIEALDHEERRGRLARVRKKTIKRLAKQIAPGKSGASAHSR